MLPILLLAVLSGGSGPSAQAASPAAPTAAPPESSAALTAALPELAATPGIVIVGYPVSGRSARAIRESINEGRPADSTGERFDGMTTWRYSTRWRGGPDGGCDPSTAEVTTSVVVTLPELTSRDAVDRRTRESWDRYLGALAGHEHNHVRVAMAGAEQLVTFMRGAPNCATMEAARQQIDAAIRSTNEQYDAATRHGATEGARFP